MVTNLICLVNLWDLRQTLMMVNWIRVIGICVCIYDGLFFIGFQAVKALDPWEGISVVFTLVSHFKCSVLSIISHGHKWRESLNFVLISLRMCEVWPHITDLSYGVTECWKKSFRLLFTVETAFLQTCAASCMFRP